MQITEQKFGVISDFLGDREDVPNVKLPNVYLPESSGVFLQYGMVRTMPGANEGAFVDADGVKVRTPDTNPVIHQWRHVKGGEAGIEYVFAFTKAHIYSWSETLKTYTTMWTCTADCTLWDTVSINGKIIATNGIDFVLVWDEESPGTAFAPLDGATGLDLDGAGSLLMTAKYCATFEGYLILGATTEGGDSHPYRERWSSYGDETDFDVNGNGDTGYKDFREGSDGLKGFGEYTYGNANHLIVFKEKSVYAQVLVEGLSVWNAPRIHKKHGLLATHSVINDKEGNLYYIASDYTIRKFREGVISRGKAPTIKGISVTLQDQIEATFIDSYNQIWWSIPSSGTSTGNDKVIALNLDYLVWHDYDFAIRSFGDWTRQESHTIDGLDALSDTIDGLDAELPYIDYVSMIAGFPLDICSDHSGYTYILHTSETEKGSAVTRSMVISVDLTQKMSLNIYKRINWCKAYFAGRSSAGSLSIFTKCDNEEDWQSQGTISLESTKAITDVDLAIDIRAKHFLFKVTATVLFDFLGMFFDFEFDGDR